MTSNVLLELPTAAFKYLSSRIYFGIITGEEDDTFICKWPFR